MVLQEFKLRIPNSWEFKLTNSKGHIGIFLLYLWGWSTEAYYIQCSRVQYCSCTYSFQKWCNGEKYSNAKTLFSLLQPCRGKEGSLSQHTWFPTSRTERGRLQLQVCDGYCSLKLRQLVTDTFRVQSEWATASCHIKAPAHSSIWGSPIILLLFFLRP